MRIDVITLFPDWLTSVIEYGVIKRAAENQLVELNCINPRDFTTDVHRTVDDRPYGGGPGMVMRADCIIQAIRYAQQQNSGIVVYLSPQGQTLTQEVAKDLATQESLILLCGRYEGIDERAIQLEVDAEYSIGDYVLSGGELPAMVLIDSVVRLLPGVLGHQDSAEQDSFADGLLDCPHYTRPEMVEGLGVPGILKSGDHARIDRWRRKQSLGNTWLKRPDLLQKKVLQPADQKLLDEYIQENRISSEVDHE